jgi:hypothetical protein
MHISEANDDTLPLKVTVQAYGLRPSCDAGFGRFSVIYWYGVRAAEHPVSDRVPSGVVREWSHTLDTADCHG